MEIIPKHIEDKIANLPIVSMTDQEGIQAVLESQDFIDVFAFYKAHYLPENLQSKPDIVQKVSLYLNLTNQGEDYIQQSEELIYRRPVPAIEEFLTNKFYMGYSNASLYPYWRKQLCHIFKTGSPLRKVIFSGSIGTGKSTIARKAFIYVLYRLFCLRDARACFNIDQDATIANVVISLTLKQVYETNVLPFVKLMESMPCFQRVMSQRSFEGFDLSNPKCPVPFVAEKSTGNIYFPENIIMTCGSNAGHFTGYNVVNSFTDEISDYGNIEDTLALLNALDNRFASRFQGSPLVFQSVVSSARSENSAMGEYVRKLPKDDPSILKLSPKLYEVKSEDSEFVGDGTKFWVLVGNGSIPSRIIDNQIELDEISKGNFETPPGCTLIDVPTIYKPKFEMQLEQSIQDIAGMTTADNNMLFRDTSKIEDPQLLPEMYLDADIRDNLDLITCLPINKIFKQSVDGVWRFIRSPNAPRCIHVDLAAGGEDRCDAGICMSHKEYSINKTTGNTDVIFVVDFVMAINARNKIDILAIQNMLINLVKRYNANIAVISSDQWNGEIFQQALKASGCFGDVVKLSVDTTCEPYTNAASYIEMGRVKAGTCPKLRKELECLVLDGKKVRRTVAKKDMADALVGSIHSLQKYCIDLPTYNYDSLSTKTTHTNYNDLIDQKEEYLSDLK